jgi:HD-GYP domain-containing protein (c-di-GMP phosphodiesterase class II)
MKVPNVWLIETAAALSQIGCVILPEAAIKKLYDGQELSGEEFQLFAMHPLIASDLLSHIPRMQTIADIIANQEKNFDGSGFPHESKGGEEIPLGARILKVVLDFDTLKARDESDGEGVLERLARMPGRYDPKVLRAFRKTFADAKSDEELLMANQLKDGMILAQDMMMLDGRMLVARGYEVNRTLRERIKSFSEKPGIKEPVRVIIPETGPGSAREGTDEQYSSAQ